MQDEDPDEPYLKHGGHNPEVSRIIALFW